MKTAGQGGSKYTSYTVAAQELIQGCIDIVDEVCTQKSDVLTQVRVPTTKLYRITLCTKLGCRLCR